MQQVHVQRVTDPEPINAILNDPKVRPDIADLAEGPVDVSDKVANPNVLFLMGEHGGVMLLRAINGIWEVHTFVRPEGRGEWALAMIRSAQHWLFTRTDAFEVLTRIPEPNKAAKGLAIMAGMSKEFHRPDGAKINGQIVPTDIYRLTIQEWTRKAMELEGRGEWFHGWIAAEAAKYGYNAPHENDPEHNRVVGATLEMMLGGQPVKGVMLYNRWAWMARHATISLVGADPLTVAFDIGHLKLANGELEFVPWKKTMN